MIEFTVKDASKLVNCRSLHDNITIMK